jgi:hypothetical protein
MPRANRHAIVERLREHGATEGEAAHIVGALARAGLNPPAMRVWLEHPRRAFSVNSGIVVAGVELKRVPADAIQQGQTGAVVAAAEAFAAAGPDERYIARTLLCDLDGVRRLTHGAPERTATVVEIARRLKAALGKEVHVNEVVQQVLTGSFDGDQTRLIDWMRDERLGDALEAIVTGRIDPVALNRQNALGFWGW